MSEKILYAKVHETSGWQDLVVYLNDILAPDFVEVDVLGCWGVRYARDDAGNFVLRGDEFATEKMYGQFRLERRESEPGKLLMKMEKNYSDVPPSAARPLVVAPGLDDPQFVVKARKTKRRRKT